MFLETATTLRGTEKVKKAVHQWIKANKPRPGEKFHSQNQLARMLHVDPMTAHKALTELAGEKVIYRIKGKGSFIGPDPSLKLGLRLAFVTPGANFENPKINPNCWHIIQRINTFMLQGLKENDSFSTLIVAPGSSNARDIKRLSSYDAVFFSGYEEFSSLIEKLIKHDTTVVIDGISGECDFDCIKIFRYLEQDVKTGVSYLIERGYKNIAYIGASTSFRHGKLKLSGYQEALKDYGMKFNEQLVFEGINNHNEGSRGAAMLVNRKVKFDAVFVDTDLKAIGVIEYLTLNGIKIPENVGVMGFDGVDQCIGPPLYLTSIKLTDNAIATAINFIRKNGRTGKVFNVPQKPRRIIENRTTK